MTYWCNVYEKSDGKHQVGTKWHSRAEAQRATYGLAVKYRLRVTLKEKINVQPG